MFLKTKCIFPQQKMHCFPCCPFPTAVDHGGLLPVNKSVLDGSMVCCIPKGLWASQPVSLLAVSEVWKYAGARLEPDHHDKYGSSVEC